MKPLRLAVDTNVLLDLADGVEAVLDTFALLDQRLPGNDMLVVPSVLDELAFLCDSGENDRVRHSALRALKLVREQDRFRPCSNWPTPTHWWMKWRENSGPAACCRTRSSRFPDSGRSGSPGLRAPFDQRRAPAWG